MERIKRDNYVAQVCSLLGKGEAVVLTGHRRAGKSCILELLAAELATDGHVIYIDMEDPVNIANSFAGQYLRHHLREGHRAPQKCTQRVAA